MTEKFNNMALNIYKSIRKPMQRSGNVIQSKKDKHKKKDIKQGRKDARYFNESRTTR